MTTEKVVKKVLLINPPSIVKQSWIDDVGSFPLGLAFIAAVLDENDIEVEIIDCFIEGFNNRDKINNKLIRIGMTDNEIVDAVIQTSPDLIGISIQFSCQLSSALHISSIIKRVNQDIITVVGGNHVSAAPKSIDRDTIDWIIIGEGEYRLLNLIKSINSKNTYKAIPSVYRTSDEIRNTNLNIKSDFIKDLDSLPLPMYRMLPLEKYWKTSGRRWINMIATRGCPHNCVFCSIHTVMGKRVRYRSVEKLLKEIIFFKHELELDQIFFEDDNLTFNMKWAKELFQKIIEENLGLEIYLRNGIRFDKVDLELLILMKKAGVQRVWFAPESGSQTTLDKVIKKRIKLEDCEKAIRMAKNTGLDVTCFLVIGFPEETMEDIKQTIQYGYKLKKIGCDSIWISCAVPYPGTELFNNCIDRGIITEDTIDYQSMSTMDSIIYNKWFSSDEIKTIRDQAMIELNRLSIKDKLKVLQKRLALLFSNPSLFIRKTSHYLSYKE
ncbi:B12-binding domain-containing radical SAM protein [Acidobacteriota bacterium]